MAIRLLPFFLWGPRGVYFLISPERALLPLRGPCCLVALLPWVAGKVPGKGHPRQGGPLSPHYGPTARGPEPAQGIRDPLGGNRAAPAVGQYRGNSAPPWGAIGAAPIQNCFCCLPPRDAMQNCASASLGACTWPLGPLPVSLGLGCGLLGSIFNSGGQSHLFQKLKSPGRGCSESLGFR